MARGDFYWGLARPNIPLEYVAGPRPYSFSGADRAAAAAARDTYANAHPQWRAVYAANRGDRPRYAIRLDAGTERIWQIVATVSGGANTLTWRDVAALGVVQGETGAKGDPGDGASIPELAARMAVILRKRDDITLTYDASGHTVTVGRKYGSTEFIRRCAWSADATFTSAEMLAGAASSLARIVVPPAPGNADAYLGFWLEGEGHVLERLQIGALSILGEFTRSALTVGTTTGTLYASRDRLTARMAGSTALLI